MLTCIPSEYNYPQELEFMKSNLHIHEDELKLLITILHSQNLYYTITGGRAYIMSVNYTRITHYLLENYCKCFNHYYCQKLEYDEWQDINDGTYKMKMYGFTTLIDFNKKYDGQEKNKENKIMEE